MDHDDLTLSMPQPKIQKGMSRRQFLRISGLGALGIATASLATACVAAPAAAPGTGASTGSGAASSESVTITALVDSQDEPWYRQRSDLFTEEQGTTVELEVVPNADYATKLQTNIAGDTSTDLFVAATSNGLYYVLADQEVALDLSSLVTRDKYDLGQFFESSIQNLSGPFEGRLYGLPYSGHPSGMHWVYNADVTQAAGAEEPTAEATTDDLLTWAQSVLSDGVWGFYPPVHLWRDIVPMALTFDAPLLSEDNRTAQLNTAEAMVFWEWIYDIFQVSKVSPMLSEMPSGGMRDMFIAQQLVSMSDSVGFRSIQPTIEGQFTWGVVPFPKGPTGTRASHVQSNAIMAWAKTEQPDAAWEWQKWMVSKDSAVALGKVSAAPGERPDAWADPAFADDPFHAVTQELMKVGHPVMNPANFRTSEMQTLLIGSLNQLWNGEAAFDQAFFDSLNGEVQAILDKPNL